MNNQHDERGGMNRIYVSIDSDYESGSTGGSFEPKETPDQTQYMLYSPRMVTVSPKTKLKLELGIRVLYSELGWLRLVCRLHDNVVEKGLSSSTYIHTYVHTYIRTYYQACWRKISECRFMKTDRLERVDS